MSCSTAGLTKRGRHFGLQFERRREEAMLLQVSQRVATIVAGTNYWRS